MKRPFLLPGCLDYGLMAPTGASEGEALEAARPDLDVDPFETADAECPEATARLVVGQSVVTSQGSSSPISPECIV